MNIEAMKLALEALEAIHPEVVCTVANHTPKYRHENAACGVKKRHVQAITALRQAIEQSEQAQPKCGAIIEVFGKDWRLEYMSLPVGKHKLYTQQYEYTAPPHRKPLTYPQIHELDWPDDVAFEEILLFVRAIEAAHGIKEKNT